MTDEPSPSPRRARPRPQPARADIADPPDDVSAQNDVSPENDVVPENDVSPENDVAGQQDERADGASRHRRARRGPLRRWTGGDRRRQAVVALTSAVLAVVIAVVLVLSLLGSDGSGGSGTPTSTVGDRVASLDDPDLATAFIGGASSDIAAVTSYSYRTLSSDLSNGEVVTTGAYRASYRAALTGDLAATARRLHRVQTFELRSVGISEINDQGTSAKVLMFGTQTVTDDSTDRKPRSTLVTLTATIQRDGQRYRISGLVAGANAGLPPGSVALSDAAEAGREEVTNLLTMRRAHLDADYNAALTLAVEPLRTQVGKQAASVRRAITRGRYDLTGKVTAVAIGSAGGDTVVMFVAATGTKVTASGRSSVVTDGRYEVVVVRVAGAWRVSQVVPITAN